MPVFRKTPYAAFNFLVSLAKGEEKQDIGGFSEVSGLNVEVTVAEYRVGNAKENYVKKIPGITKAGDVTLKRGVIGAQNINAWIKSVKAGKFEEAKRDVLIHLLDEKRSDTPVVSWKLKGAMPLKWTGPTLAAKGGGDVAMEEFVLSVEDLEEI